MIFACIFVAFMFFAACVCKRRCAEKNKGKDKLSSKAVRGNRKKLPLTEEDPNLSLIEG